MGKGDRVNIYLGMVPELPIAMLACARIGAPHSVVFGGFSAEALRDRINDAQAKVLITADGAWRRGTIVPLKDNADEAVAECPTIEHVITVRRCGNEHAFQEGRDHWYHELVDGPVDRVRARADGRRGPPLPALHERHDGQAQGDRAHNGRLHDPGRRDAPDDLRHPRRRRVLVRGGLRVGHRAQLHRLRAAREPHDRRDVRGRARLAGQGSVVGSIIERYGVTILYTAPTAIRAFMRWGTEFPERHDLSSLRLLGSVGEPINPEAWVWYWKVIGGERCPVVDTWWQTETGRHLDHRRCPVSRR